MTRERGRDLAAAIVVAVAALVFLPRALAPGSALADLVPESVVLTLTPLVKLACLAVAAFAAVSCARAFEAGNPVRPAWRLLAAGLVLYAVGQATLVVYQLGLRVATPFPSVADVFFVLSLLFLVPAFPAFVRAYRDSGLPFDARRDVVVPGAVALVLGIAILALIHPVFLADRFGLAEALNLFYPLSDVLLLVPAVVLARVTARLRGGKVATVWALLVAGFVMLVAGDVLFAWLTIAEAGRLDPLVDLTFVASYAAIARATLRQRELLAG